MDLQKLLNSFGLTETEAKLYLTSLKQPYVSVSELAEKTGLKRPAIYHALETLEKKGLVTPMGTEKILRYRAEQPEQLKSLLRRKAIEIERLEKKIDKAIPLFPTAKELTKSEASVEFFRGKEAIRNLAERSLDNEKKHLFAIIPSFEIFLDAITKEFAAHYIQEKKKRGIRTQSVWAKSLENETEFRKEVTNHAEFLREVRFAPEYIAKKYRSIILIWDDNVAVISTSTELFGVLITSDDYAETMKAMWSVLWDASKSPEIKLVSGAAGHSPL